MFLEILAIPKKIPRQICEDYDEENWNLTPEGYKGEKPKRNVDR
jgi:hypothetical protein